MNKIINIAFGVMIAAISLYLGYQLCNLHWRDVQAKYCLIDFGQEYYAAWDINGCVNKNGDIKYLPYNDKYER